MSKTIRVEDGVYEQLTPLKTGNETYSEVISQLLDLKKGVEHFIKTMELPPEYRKLRIDLPEMGSDK